MEEFLGKRRHALNVNNSDYVFLPRKGTPLSQGMLNKQIKKAVYERTGGGTNVYLIRHIWATEYIEGTQNFNVPAAVLGDKPETVRRCYAHIQIHEAGRRADEFLVEVLNTAICARGECVV